MNRLLPTLMVIAVLGVLCAAFPPFQVRSLKAVRAAQAGGEFNAADFAGRFWNGELLPAVAKAADAAAVLDKIAADPKSVRERYGRTVGVGSSYYLFLRGDGRVVSVDGEAVGLSLKPDGTEAQIVVPLGFVFGSAVRDATGLIQASSFPNAQEFNDIAAALNSIVETNVLPQLKRAANVGSRIRFAGCAEVGDEDLDLTPLKLVPIEVKEQNH
jgi:predicted lipoprotein